MHICSSMCIYFKHELMPKGAYHGESVPDVFKDTIVKEDSIKIFTRTQQDGFTKRQSMSDGWFLKCLDNFVYRKEKHLVRVSLPNATTSAPIEINVDNNDHFSIVPSNPAPPPAHLAHGALAPPKARATRKYKDVAADSIPNL